jgi:hypothetical protein
MRMAKERERSETRGEIQRKQKKAIRAQRRISFLPYPAIVAAIGFTL